MGFCCWTLLPVTYSWIWALAPGLTTNPTTPVAPPAKTSFWPKPPVPFLPYTHSEAVPPVALARPEADAV